MLLSEIRRPGLALVLALTIPPAVLAEVTWSDDFEDGTIDASLWVWRGHDDRGVGGGSWQFAHEEIVDADGHLRVRVWGPGSAASHGAEAWVRTASDYNDGSNHALNFTWAADVNASHVDMYAIQITDGSIPEGDDLYWYGSGAGGEDGEGWKNIFFQYEQNDLAPTEWSVHIDAASGMATLFSSADLMGSIIGQKSLPTNQAWHVRFIQSDATSAGYPAGDNLLNLYRLDSSTTPLSIVDLDCNSNAITDACDIDCGSTGGPCDVPGCGQSADCNSNAVPDECESDAELSFRQGAGYAGCRDTSLQEDYPDTSFGSDVDVAIDWSPENHGLLRFDGIFGTSPDQTPYGATIVCARLTLHVTNPAGISTTLHRMLQPWNETDTWNSWGSGIQNDGIEAEPDPDPTIPIADIGSYESIPVVDVTSSLQAWSDGAANYGWFLKPGDESADGWEFASRDHEVESMRPLLEVVLRIPPDCNTNGIPDNQDIASGTSQDCNSNSVPDECEITAGTGADCNTNSIPDECEPNFDGDAFIDDCDADIDDDGVPNEEDACDFSPDGAPIIDDPEHPAYGTHRGTLLGDINGDCDCDLYDYKIMQGDFTGPNPPPWGQDE